MSASQSQPCAVAQERSLVAAVENGNWSALVEAWRNEQARSERLEAVLLPIVAEFWSTIEQYRKLGPDYTFKDGTEVFEVSTVLDRAGLIEDARATLNLTSPTTKSGNE